MVGIIGVVSDLCCVKMSVKIFVILVLAVVGSQAVTEVILNDVTVTHISNPVIPKSISIGILFLDKLISCHVIFPNGLMYELYPNEQTLPHASVSSAAAGGDTMFPSCGMFFLNSPASMSGTYELLSLVEHTLDNSRTLTRQKTHITFEQSEVEWPFKNTVQGKITPTADVQ